jgi:hypothetical protein
MNSRSSSQLSYRNVLIAAGLAAALGGQGPDGSLEATSAAAGGLEGHEGAMSPATTPTASSPTGTAPPATASPGARDPLPPESWR